MAPQTRARLLILGTALLFSTGGAAIKGTDFGAWQVAGFRSGVAAVALILLLPAWRRFWEPRALLVGVGYAAMMVLYVTANKLTTAANAIFLQGTAPLYVLLLAPRLLGEPAQRGDLYRVAALGFGLALFFAGAEAPLATAPDPLLGNLVALASGLTWGLTLLGLRWLGRGAPADAHAAGRAVVAGNCIAFLVCLPFALPMSGGGVLDWGLVAFLGLFQIGLAYVWLTRGVREVRALEVSLLLLLEPVASGIWSWAIHAELPGPWALSGCAVVLVATLAMALRDTGGSSS